MNKRKGEEHMSAEEAEFTFQSGIAITNARDKRLKELGKQIDKDLKDATILKLFSRDRTTLGPDEVEILKKATEGINDYIIILEEQGATLKTVIKAHEVMLNKKED